MFESITIPHLINKEMIPNLRFPDSEVLNSTDSIIERRSELERALTLGNLEHGKIKLIFEDEESIYQVETTVWGLTDKRVILKQGIVIPIQRIHIVKI